MALSLICKQGFRVSKAGSVFRRWVGVAPCKGWPAKPHINAEEIGQEDDSESLACGDERLCNPFDKTDKPEKPTSSYTSPLSGRESVPALEVPLSNLPFQDDEMLSWLQYPLEDSFDRNYCSEELFTGSPISHSNPVQDAFSHLTLKEGKNPQSVGLRSQTFTPSDTITGERNLAADVAMVVDAQRAAGLLTPPVTNTGERALAANAAMAMGARRAAGLLSQSGAEAFNRVRTNAQPYISKRSHTVLPTQEGALTQFNIPSHALTAMDTKSAFKAPSQCLTKPNFPLFSRAVAATKTSVQGVRTCSNTEGVRQPVNTHGKDVLSAGADSTATAMTTSLDSPTLQCHVTSTTAEKSSEPFHAHVKKGWCVSTAQSNANAMTGMGSSRLQPYHDGITRRPLIAHLKEGLSSSVTASTTTSVTGMGSCKLQADGSGPTDIESARQPNMAQVKGGLSSCASESNAATGPGTGCKLLADLSSMTNNETGTQLFLSQEGLPSESAATVTTDRDPYMHLELTRHGRETSQGITNPGRSLPPMPPYGKVPIAGKELELGTCPVTASWALTPSEKLCETLETGDVTMASPSRGSGNSTEKSTKEAAPCSTKRKTGPAEDSESESKEFENGKPASGRSSGAKRTRAAEIHNLSERKRRDKINVKIKALQDLIPNANKTDKASILDEAIEYMKMLQSQVQFMSMRTGMVVPPMLLPPGMQSPPMQQRLLSPNMNMGLGTSMGFGMGMGMGMGMLDATSASWRGVMSMPPALGQPLSASAYNAAFCQLGSSYPVILEEQGHMQIHGNTLLPVQQQQQQPLHLNMPMNADMYVAFRQQQQQQHTQEIPSSNAMQ